MLQLHQGSDQNRTSPEAVHKEIRVAEAKRPGMCGMTSICATLANLVFQIDCEPIVNINPMLRRLIVIFTLASTTEA